jgi:hypothetical protein
MIARAHGGGRTCRPVERTEISTIAVLNRLPISSFSCNRSLLSIDPIEQPMYPIGNGERAALLLFLAAWSQLD